MTNGQRVLVVDRFPETREVLRTIFEPRGLHVDSTPSRQQSDPHEQQPDVIVIDAETLPTAQSEAENWNGVPLVIIGSARIEDPQPTSGDPSRRYLEKPFQYPELIQAVEQLLSTSAPNKSPQ